MTTHAHQAVQYIQQTIKTPFVPKIGIILGSGSGALAEEIENATVIPYVQLPGFHTTSVEGHKGNLLLGTIEGVPVACLQGRAHYYEGVTSGTIQTMLRTLKLLGCEILLVTNAAGSLRAEIPVGSLLLIKDHINFQFTQVLVGANDPNFGPRFPSLHELYDKKLREQFLQVGKKLKIDLYEGIYIGVLGPAFETPAEINAFRILGADVVGMSTIPEVMVAHHCSMRVIAISVITNLAAGLTHHPLTHEETLNTAQRATEQLIPLILNFIASIANSGVT